MNIEYSHLMDGFVGLSAQVAGDPTVIHHRMVDLIWTSGPLLSWKKYMSDPEVARLVQQDVPNYCVGVVSGSGAGRYL